MLKNELYDTGLKEQARTGVRWRLPPYHCIFNPIELIWMWIKQKVAKGKKTFKSADVLTLMNKAVSAVTLDQWRNVCQHCKKLVNEFWVNDCLQEEVIGKRIVGLESNDGKSDVGDGSLRDNNDGDDIDSHWTLGRRCWIEMSAYRL